MTRSTPEGLTTAALTTAALTTAALTNASWCDAVCRSHGLPTGLTPTRWYARRRTPIGYPDAVTLVPGLDPAAVLEGTAPGPGRSVKDSFADLDLAPAGFDVLFAASWIRADPDPRSPRLPWRPVTDRDGLERWRSGHDLPAAFRPELLGEPGLTLYVIVVGTAVVARAAVNAVRGGVGVSNVFSTERQVDDVWADLPRLAAHVGDGPVWGYESGDDLVTAERAGFVATGPLRIWLDRAGAEPISRPRPPTRRRHRRSPS